MSLEVFNRGRLARGYNLVPERGRERETTERKYESRRGRRRWRGSGRGRGKRMLSLEDFKWVLKTSVEFSLHSIEFELRNSTEFEAQLRFRLLHF